MEPAKILVVDDDPDILAVLAELLKKEGHHVSPVARVAPTRSTVLVKAPRSLRE